MPVVTERQDKHLPAREAGEGGRPAGRHPTRPAGRGDRWRRLAPAVAGWLSMLAGLAGIAGQLAAELPGRYPQLARGAHQVSAVVPVAGLATAARVADVIAGLLLLMLSHGLRRRKHRAWQAVTALLAASAVLDLLDGLRVTPAAVSAALIAVLWCFRGEFYAAGDPRTRWRALRVLPALLAADAATGLAFIALPGGLAGAYGFGQRLRSVAFGLAGVSGPVRFLAQDRGDLFAATTGALGLFTVVVTAYLFLRPPEPSSRLTEEDAGRIRDLLARHGARDSLGYFALRRDKHVIWSPTGKSCIGYRVACGVMLASGDPVGDPEAWPGAMHAFLAEAARHAWVPAVIGCGELAAAVWCREGGLAALQIGDEAIVETGGYTLPGQVLQDAERARGEHAAVEVRRAGDMSREEAARLARQAAALRGSPAGRGFPVALGRLGGDGDQRCVLATATQDGTLRAVLHFVPWGADGLCLDLVRRDRAAPAGLAELLIAEVIRRAPELGVQRVSLNFAAFREALELGQRIGAGPVLRAWRKILVFLPRWLQIEARYTFVARFRPAWSPRFLVYPGTATIPRVTVAALQAEVPPTGLAVSRGWLATWRAKRDATGLPRRRAARASRSRPVRPGGGRELHELLALASIPLPRARPPFTSALRPTARSTPLGFPGMNPSRVASFSAVRCAFRGSLSRTCSGVTVWHSCCPQDVRAARRCRPHRPARLASIAWPGPDSSPAAPGRPAMAINSASAGPCTSSRAPAAKPTSVATTRSPRIRQNPPMSGPRFVMLEVVAHDFPGHAVERLLCRRGLVQHVDTVPVLVDHPADPGTWPDALGAAAESCGDGPNRPALVS